MSIDVGVDHAHFTERGRVQFLQDLELDAAVRFQRVERLGERGDDRGGTERIRRAFQHRFADQVADAAIERDELFVAHVLDDPHDVADDHRLVHDVELDEGELRRVGLGEIGALVGTPGYVILDARAQALLELGHQRCAADDQHLPRFEEELLLVTDVGLAGALHQHVAHPVEQRRERQQQAMDRDVAAVGEYLRQLPGDGRRAGT